MRRRAGALLAAGTISSAAVTLTEHPALPSTAANAPTGTVVKPQECAVNTRVCSQAATDSEAADLDCSSPATAGQLPPSHWCASPELPRVELPRPGSARRAHAGSAASSPLAASGWRRGADAVPDCRLEPVLQPGAVVRPAARGQALPRVVPTLSRACARARSAECLPLRTPASLPPRAASTDCADMAGHTTGAPPAPPHSWHGTSGFSAAPPDFMGAAGVSAGAAGERDRQGFPGARAAPRAVCASALAAVAVPLGPAPGGIRFWGGPKAAAHEGEPVALGRGGRQQRMRWPSPGAAPAAQPAWCLSGTAALARGACASAWHSPDAYAGQVQGLTAGFGPGHAAGGGSAFHLQDAMEADHALLTADHRVFGAQGPATAAQAGAWHGPATAGCMPRAAHVHNDAGAPPAQPDSPGAENRPAAANRSGPGGSMSPGSGLAGFSKGAGHAEKMRLQAAAAAAARPTPCAEDGGAHGAQFLR